MPPTQPETVPDRPCRPHGAGLLAVVGSSAVVFGIAAQFDLMERYVAFAHQHEALNLDEFLIVTAYLAVVGLGAAMLRWRDALRASEVLAQRNRELQTALDEVRQLRGILPICAACKRIRDDAGYWHQVDVYVRDHSEAEFTHGLCPECVRELYPELDEEDLST